MGTLPVNGPPWTPLFFLFPFAHSCLSAFCQRLRVIYLASLFKIEHSYRPPPVKTSHGNVECSIKIWNNTRNAFLELVTINRNFYLSFFLSILFIEWFDIRRYSFWELKKKLLFLRYSFQIAALKIVNSRISKDDRTVSRPDSLPPWIATSSLRPSTVERVNTFPRSFEERKNRHPWI